MAVDVWGHLISLLGTGMETGKRFSESCACGGLGRQGCGEGGLSEGAADTDLNSCSERFGKQPPEGTFRKETSEIVEQVILHMGLIPHSGAGMLVSQVLPDLSPITPLYHR